MPSRVSQKFAASGKYASRRDRHGARGHHTGIDYGSAWPVPIKGRRVRAITDGKVVISGYNETMGNWVGVYNFGLDLLVTYWHLSKRNVDRGDWVLAYHVIGFVGSTGNSTAPHLHMQVNAGRDFNYHGHLSPWRVLNHVTRSYARQRYEQLDGKHPKAS